VGDPYGLTMEFGFDDQQLAMRDAARSLCEDRFSLASISDREGAPADSAAWTGLDELGILGMLAEGSGTGMVEAALVFEQLGTSLVSGPVLWSTLASSLLPAGVDRTSIATGIELTEGQCGPFVIEHLAESDVLVLLGRTSVEFVPVADLEPVEVAASLDPLTPVAVVETLPEGTPLGGRDLADRLRRQGAVLASAMLGGVARGALDVARTYSLEREQFGVPIGSFQAIKHLLADMYVRVELAQAATYAAAAIVDGCDDDDVDQAVASAKLLAGEAAHANGRSAIQVLGGMGFTWEMLPHYYLKRAWMLDQAFGTMGTQAERLGTLLAQQFQEARS